MHVRRQPDTQTALLEADTCSASTAVHKLISSSLQVLATLD